MINSLDRKIIAKLSLDSNIQRYVQKMNPEHSKSFFYAIIKKCLSKKYF